MQDIAVDPKYYVHDLDRNALRALRAIPGFHQLTRAFMKVWQERQFRIMNMSSRVRVNERQLSEYYDMLPPICERLGIEVPELYLELDVNPNAGTYGDTKPFVVMTSGLLETIPHELVPTVLAHECGHVACHHTLYRTMGGVVFGTASEAIAQFVPFGGLASMPLAVAFYYWMRCSEYSADRAAVICDGAAEKMSDVCMRLAGFDKDIEAVANKQEFMRQADEYREMVRDSKWDKTLEFLMFNGNTHPLMAVRALECEEWVKSEQFQSIADGTFLQSVAPAEEPDGLEDMQPESEADDGERPRHIAFPKAPRILRVPWGQKGEDADETENEKADRPRIRSAADEIREFKALMDEGIITPEEFEAKKRQLLGI